MSITQILNHFHESRNPTNLLIRKLYTLNHHLFNSSSNEVSPSKPYKNQTLNPNSNHQTLKPLFFPFNLNLFFNFKSLTLYRSIHGLIANTQLRTCPNSENPCFEIDRIGKETEKICKMLSSQESSLASIDLVLDKCNIEISDILVLEVLKKLSNAGLLAHSFFKWAGKKNGFVHTTDTYNALIEALGKIKQFNLIWELVNKEMRNRGLLSKETFALISRRYARARKVKEAIETFERTEKFGFKLELQDYNRLIDTLSKSRNVERAHEVFDKWKNKKFRPDIKSYTILLEGWGQEQNLLRLDEVYREMRGEGFQPDVVAYGIIINAYCKARKYDDAIRMYNEMKGKGVKPSPHIYCSLINGLGGEKRLDEAVKYFEELKTSGFEPEMPTYNALVGAYCWSNRMYDAYRVVDEMRKSDIGPNSRTFDIILHHLVKGKRNKEAYSVFQKMGDEKGCEPTVSTYEIMVRMFCHEERTDMAVRVWDQMRERGVLPGMHMFSALINGLCHENKVDEACKYFEEMLHMGIRPPTHMFKHLKRVLLDEGKEDTLLSLGRRIENLRGTLPQKRTFRKGVGTLRGGADRSRDIKEDKLLTSSRKIEKPGLRGRYVEGHDE